MLFTLNGNWNLSSRCGGSHYSWGKWLEPRLLAFSTFGARLGFAECQLLRMKCSLRVQMPQCSASDHTQEVCQGFGGSYSAIAAVWTPTGTDSFILGTSTSYPRYLVFSAPWALPLSLTSESVPALLPSVVSNKSTWVSPHSLRYAMDRTA